MFLYNNQIKTQEVYFKTIVDSLFSISPKNYVNCLNLITRPVQRTVVLFSGLV